MAADNPAGTLAVPTNADIILYTSTSCPPGEALPSNRLFKCQTQFQAELDMVKTDADRSHQLMM
jgi:hypothetical protein